VKVIVHAIWIVVPACNVSAAMMSKVFQDAAVVVPLEKIIVTIPTILT
jgi:hypothetical protein